MKNESESPGFDTLKVAAMEQMPLAPENDLLSSVMSAYQLRAGVYANPRLCGAWQFGISGMKRASFHLVGEGQCWLHTRLQQAQPLEGGDLVVFPHDAWHLLSGERQLDGEDQRPQTDGADNFTTLVCGYFEFLVGEKNPLLEALPQMIVVRREEASGHFSALGRLLLQETQTHGLGTKTVLDKLADTLFVMVVRHHVNTARDRRGLLAGLADPRIRNALAAIHRNPGAAWTLDLLAQEAAMSRTAFAQRFPELLGTTPMDYVTRWRMTQAELMLRQPRASVAAIAEALGYESETAFRRAFKRVHGFSAGSLRRWFRSHFSASANDRGKTGDQR